MINIDPKTKEFYYTDRETYCCNIETEPIFDNITPFNFPEPIKQLAKYYHGSDPNYYEELYDRIKNKNLENQNPLFIKKYNYDLDETALQYIKCFKNMSCLVVWPISKYSNIFTTEFYDYLTKNGTVHIVKEIDVSYKQVQGMIYQIYYDKSGFKNLNSIKGKQQKGKADSDHNTFFIIFYEAKDFNAISGKDAPLKIKLREIIKKESHEPENTSLNYFLHITDNHTQCVELAQLFCNKNSMRIIQYARLDRVLHDRQKNSKALIYLMTFKNWLYQKIKPIDHIRFMLYSSIVLYSLGLRDANDLDVYVHYLPEKSKTKDFFELVHYFLENSGTQFPFVLDGATIKNRSGFEKGGEKEYLLEWFNKEWPSLFNSRSMDETVLNPRFHYYYFGIKIVSAYADLQRRFKRSRPAAYADIIALIILCDVKMIIPPIPKGYWKNHIYYKMTETELTVLYKKIKFYLQQRYGIRLEIPQIMEYIKF